MPQRIAVLALALSLTGCSADHLINDCRRGDVPCSINSDPAGGFPAAEAERCQAAGEDRITGADGDRCRCIVETAKKCSEENR